MGGERATRDCRIEHPHVATTGPHPAGQGAAQAIQDVQDGAAICSSIQHHQHIHPCKQSHWQFCQGMSSRFFFSAKATQCAHNVHTHQPYTSQNTALPAAAVCACPTLMVSQLFMGESAMVGIATGTLFYIVGVCNGVFHTTTLQYVATYYSMLAHMKRKHWQQTN